MKIKLKMKILKDKKIMNYKLKQGVEIYIRIHKRK